MSIVGRRFWRSLAWICELSFGGREEPRPECRIFYRWRVRVFTCIFGWRRKMIGLWRCSNFGCSFLEGILLSFLPIQVVREYLWCTYSSGFKAAQESWRHEFHYPKYKISYPIEKGRFKYPQRFRAQTEKATSGFIFGAHCMYLLIHGDRSSKNRFFDKLKGHFGFGIGRRRAELVKEVDKMALLDLKAGL